MLAVITKFPEVLFPALPYRQLINEVHGSAYSTDTTEVLACSVLFLKGWYPAIDPLTTSWPL